MKRRNKAVIAVKLIGLIYKLWGIMAIAVINGSIGSLMATSITLLGAIGIGQILTGEIIINYGLLYTMIILFGIMRGVLRYFEQYSNHYIAFSILAIIRSKMFDTIRRNYVAITDGRDSGDMISMITADTETLEVFYAHTVSPLFIALITSCVNIIFTALFVHICAAILLIVFYITVGLIMPLISFKIIGTDGEKYRIQFADFNAYFMDTIKGTDEILLNNECDVRKKSIRERSLNLNRLSAKIKTRSDLIAALISFAISISGLSAVGVGIYLASNGLINTMQLIVYVVISLSTFGTIVALGVLPSSLNQTFSCANRMFDIMDMPVKTNERVSGEEINFTSLEVKDLSFGYDSENRIINHSEFKVDKGEIVGIKGASGVGKSTLLKLLLGMYNKSEGEILYNGIDIENISTHSLRKNVVMLSQQTYLFEGTLRENVMIAKPEATESELIKAYNEASLNELIASLPDGDNTVIKSGGSNFSQGERQRIGLARVLLSDAPLVLLDEPTSNIDSINEGIILMSLLKSKGDKTYVIVSHKNSTLSVADRIIDVEGKRIC